MVNNNTDILPTIINRNGNEVERPDKGGIPGNMPEPAFLADPNHRKKTLKSCLYGFVKKKVANQKTMTKCDCVCISTNFAYMARTLNYKTTDEEIVTAGKAVLEHHFDNHEHCGDWCWRKDMSTMTEKKLKKEKKKYYRCKTRDAKLYKELSDKVARFVTLSALKEVGHGYDTNMNESFNNTIAWVAPKNKVYSTTNSLKNRIAIVLGINGLGYPQYSERIFAALNITMTPDIECWIRLTHNKREHCIQKSKTKEHKKVRQKKFHDKLLEHKEQAKIERAKRDGVVYRPGVGMDDGYISDTLIADERKAKKRKACVAVNSNNNKKWHVVRCSRCGELGHNKSNKDCQKKKNQQSEDQRPKEVDQNANNDPPPQPIDDDDDDDDDDVLPMNDDTLEDQTQRDADELDILDGLDP